MDFKTEAGKKLLDECTTKLGVSYFIRETWLGELCPPVTEAQYGLQLLLNYLQIVRMHKEAKKEKAKNNDNNKKKK